MGVRLSATTAMVVLLLAESVHRRRRSVVERVTNVATQAVDMNAVIEAVDVDAVVDRIDVNSLIERIDLDDAISRIDLNKLLEGIDLDELVDRLDIDAIAQRIDIDQILDRVDPNRLLDRVDPDLLLDRVDPDRLLDRVDPNRLLDRVDTDRLIANTDLNAAADQVDIDRVMDRVDVTSIIDRAGVPELIRDSTGQVAGSVLDVARRQIVAIDQVIMRLGARVVGRSVSASEAGPPRLVAGESSPTTSGRGIVTGHYAGPLSRLVSFGLDIAIIFALFTLFSTLVLFLSDRIFGWEGNLSPQQTLVGFVLLLLWALTYSVGSLVIASRTVGKAVVGLRIVSREGDPLRVGQIVVRSLVTPIALLTFLFSYAGLFIGREHRAFTDVIARTAVVYDWGDRSAEMPAPLTQWIARQGIDPQDPQRI
ncbi:MAG: RDD family protein [Actinobacteria bacterium]|nr:RDD family protein [Actinomycetota bacterium]